ncbi:MAG: FAD-dependent monooxygenase [Bacteroidota bacterium]
MTAMDSSHFDVVIIGAGPAGTTCASLLARKGIRVLLCDKASFPREKICGDCVNPGCWDFFGLLGISDEVAVNSENVTGIKIAGRSGKILDIPLNENLPHAGIAPFIAIKRSILDSLLLDRAIRDGAIFHGATAIESILQKRDDEGSWQICLKKKENGETFNVSCGMLVGADGRNSRVAKLLYGIEAEQKKVKEVNSDRIGVQFKVKRTCMTFSDVVMFFFGGGYGGIVGVNSVESNVAMVVSRNLARLALTDTKTLIDKTIHSNQYLCRTLNPLEIIGDIRTAFPITPRRNKRHFPSAYLIGDARHTTEPFTGEGICFAMQDGVQLAQEISKSYGFAREELRLIVRNRLWNNGIFSPILRRESSIEKIITFGIRNKGLVKLASKSVFR